MLKINTPYVNANLTIDANQPGILSGLTFSVKDVMAVKGNVTGLGNPIWKDTHQPEVKNALAIQKLLDQGASLHGTTISDEFMFSIKGSNIHYGAPINPLHPECYTGGSSSGPASVVASKSVDFALGTDTGGSVRVPASYCGIYGIRPTHSVEMLQGIAPLASSFDTVGLLAHNIETFNRVGKILYHDIKPLNINQIYYLDNSLTNELSYNYQRQVKSIANQLNIDEHQLTAFDMPAAFNFSRLLSIFKRIQGFEAWQNYGYWISNHMAQIGNDIADHFQYAATIKNDDKLIHAYKCKDIFTQYIKELLGDNAILILPTTSSSAPLKNLPFEEVEKIRATTQKLTSIAGLSGTPQITLPVDESNSISILGAMHTDNALLNIAKKIALGGD